MASATYNANNQLVQWGAVTLSYDLNGNLINDSTNTYGWDARNQLASIAGSVLVNPQYDAFGRRTLNPAGQNLLYDGGNIVQEQSGNSVTANLLTGLGIDERFVRSDSTGDHSYLIDGLNSTVALTDSNANATVQYTYDPFGNTTVTGASTNAQDYTGRENDGTGLYYYRARYYSPTLQRFISEDPIGFGGGDYNLYAYVANNPVSWMDSEGDSRDTYVPDYSGKHGGPHVDRYDPHGNNVGRYDPTGKPLDHKGNESPKVPDSDQDKLQKALEKLKKKCDNVDPKHPQEKTSKRDFYIPAPILTPDEQQALVRNTALAGIGALILRLIPLLAAL